MIQHILEGAQLETAQRMGLVGYCLAVKLPETIKAPRQKGTPPNRYDIVKCLGVFPEPMQRLCTKAKGEKMALYFRHQSRNHTNNQSGEQYSLEVGGRENFTSLEPFRVGSPFYFGSPNKADNPTGVLRFATYLIRFVNYGGHEAIEVLCLTETRAREYAHYYESGELEGLLSTIRRKAQLLRWELESEAFGSWWGELHTPKPVCK